jgi:hypothetical protein
MEYREIDYVLAMPWGEKFTFSLDELITHALDINGHCIQLWLYMFETPWYKNVTFMLG